MSAQQESLSWPRRRWPTLGGLIDAEAIWMIWQREMVRFRHQPARLYSSVVRSVVWLFALGLGLRGSFVPVAGHSYTEFIFPGVIAMTLIFAALQSAISVIWDREFGFLKEVMVAPIPRVTILFGKALGGATTATLQGAIVLALAPLAGVALTPTSVVAALLLMFLTATAMGSLGLLIAVRMTDLEGYGSIQNMVVMPMFLLSGAMFPTSGIPAWLQAVLVLNPLTYGVNALRAVLLDYQVESLALDVVVQLGLTIVLLAAAGWLLAREG